MFSSYAAVFSPGILLMICVGTTAGIVMGARVPIILTSRADGSLERLASSAVALLVARHMGRL